MTVPPLAACLLAVAALSGVPAAAQSRGELLYTTHCVACHTTQVHWRDRRLAKDWNSLQAQVVNWQAAAALNWSEDDIAAVAQYLNERFYGFKAPSGPPVVLGPAARERP
ncbi:c-type cytochrome [Variovorax ginsengisoli]|uniref:Cytochrome c n=1 Tax=Variovorax ginsengisoli TaxID=363844 RepID=A0ABT8S619_9BURK|nr:cytochrome c [Variovorax ginsengisoli]MDN8615200.1 cytochrome c [Variovorax ginsengisoli]MDO1534370.1 cytochrome c [Variovorax ginsengisoli]